MELHEQPDSAIVESLQAGNEPAFDELMRRYERPVVNFCYRLLGDAGDAEDVAQEVFVRVYQKIGDYRPRAKFSTWLFALAHNAAIDRLRYRKRHPTEPLDAAPEPVTVPVGVDEISGHVAAAIAKLPEDQRTAVVLSEYHGMSYTEIAGIMRCSEKSVESRLYRAKQALRDRLKFLLD
jgi:RNA polymerase sigma factor (sigma-70 family)